ncbi:MAG: endolytic transglycosylase MltG [Muribaculaceae bacterium]|nr:endolytic transglycosylase MltG [Muribaculaceae bacterium]
MKRKGKIIIGTIVGATLIAAVGALGIWEYVTSPYEGDKPAWIYLPEGTSTEALADSLRSSLGNRVGSRTFAIYKAVAKSGNKPYGAYRIEPGTPAKDIARQIVRHRQTPVRVTFNNIRTLPQLAQRIAAQMEFTDSEFIEALDTILPAAGFKGRDEYTAAFLPDTYEFYWTTPAGSTAQRLLKTRNEFWNDTRRRKASRLGITPVQAATLASIAEEETNNRQERGKVARLYLNRVHKGMKLQADPTIKFALGDFSLRRIKNNHLKVASPFNTYANPGIPPGPIRVADARTIDALLDSEPHNYIYMCAKEDFSGTHNFASDYATHMANARRYQKALNARNIH